MNDYLITTTAFNGTVDVIAVETTNISKIASKFHNLSQMSSIMLAKTMTASILMSSFIKNDKENLTLEVNGDGKFGKIVSIVNSKLDVRAYIENTNVELCKHLNVGNKGYIKVIKDMGLKEPYVGLTNLVTGNIDEDIMYYYNFSQQILSYLVIEEVLDNDGNIERIGGILIQVMPGVSSGTIDYLKQNINKFKLFKNLLSKGYTLEEIIIYILGKENLKFKDKRKCQYKCNCSREKMKEGFISLGKKEILKIMKEDKKASLECHFCGKKYIFKYDELKNIIKNI